MKIIRADMEKTRGGNGVMAHAFASGTLGTSVEYEIGEQAIHTASAS